MRRATLLRTSLNWRVFALISTALFSIVVAPEQARAQNIGPGAFNSSVTMGSSMTVLGSTQWTPPTGSVAATVNGPGTLTFNPTLGSEPGPITVNTVNAAAIIITGSGQLSINPSASSFSTTITTTGANAYGIDVVSGQHTETMNNVIINTSGANADGIRIQNPNDIISATNATVTTTGAGASALALLSGGGATVAFTNSTLMSQAGPTIRVVDGTTETINLTGTNVTAGSGGGPWLSVTGGATGATIVASGSTLTGAAITDSVSTSNVTLANGTVWTMTGSSSVTNLTNNGSSIDFTPPAGDPTLLSSYKTLTVNNYTGTGGSIVLNAYLGTDGSPDDQLVISSAATGTTSLTINNTIGPGLETTGNGILVVNAINGATTAGAFTLDNPELRAGAFDYRLFMGGLNGTDPNDWFLRSTFIDNGGEEPIGPSPPPEPLPPGVWPIIGPELATYGVVQPTARQLGLATLGTLNQRIGDTMTLANAGSDTTGWSRSEWGRFFGQQVDDHYQAFADPRTSGWLGGFQGGLDLWRGELLPALLPGRDATGVYFAYGHANMDVSGLVTNPQATAYVLTHTGMVGMDAFSSGTYWTHYSPSGWYFDAVLQGSVYTVNATTQFASLETEGYGFVSSLEAGYPIALPLFGPHFVLEPQAQIIWQQIGFGSANDGLGQVGLGTTSGFTGRLGVRGQWTIQGYGATLWQPYVGVNFWRDWDAAATTTFGVDPVPLLEQATRTETFGGVTVKLSDHLSAYAQGGYQFAMQQTFYGIQRDGVHGDIGMRLTW